MGHEMDYIDKLIIWCTKTRTYPKYYLGADGEYYNYEAYEGNVEEGKMVGPPIVTRVNDKDGPILYGLPEKAKPFTIIYERPVIPKWIKNSDRYKEKYGEGEPDWFKEEYG